VWRQSVITTVARSSTILLVEDDTNDVLLVKMAFQKSLAGLRIMVVTNGHEALTYLKGEGPYSDRTANPFPDFVLLDLKMPLMNGFEVLRWIRTQPVIKRLPVIVFTSSLHESDATRAYEEGANSFVRKPTDFGELVETMKSLGEFWLGASKFPEANPESN
jgi:CheY-like chemotaxis protein